MKIKSTEYGVIFAVDEQDEHATGIVVEVPTRNQPLFFGADDIREKDVRIEFIVVTKNNVIVHKANGDELYAPTTISGQKEAKIYEFGKSDHYWEWAQYEGYVFLKEYEAIEYELKPCLLLRKLLMFKDHTHTITICE